MSSTGAASTSAVAANNAEDSVDYENDLDMNDEDRVSASSTNRQRDEKLMMSICDPVVPKRSWKR